MNEIWKDILGYEGYQVSNLGNVKSLNYNHTKLEKILKQCKNKDGYFRVHLCKDGKQKNFRVQRLVADAFIPNPENKPCVNHIDENKENNCVWNLEWCDHKYNNNYGTHNKRISETMLGVHINRKDQSKKVLCVETGKVYPSVRDAQRQTGIHNSHISRCCNGNRKTACGFHWQFCD